MGTVALAVTAFFAIAKPSDFHSADQWSEHPDGGRIAISADYEHARENKPSLRLIYRTEQANWGNAFRNITLPANTATIEIDLHVNSVSPGAQLWIWLFESDGDGYVAAARIGDRPIGDIPTGWHHVSVPISSFSYEARGNGRREPLTVNKILIGFSGGNADVSIADIFFQTVEVSTAFELARTSNLTSNRGPKGCVAVLRDSFPPRPGNADPNTLGSMLEKHGYGVTYLKSGDLADPNILKRDNFDCLVLPYGPSYPYAAYESIKAYLKSGGTFLSLGGYAFDEPCDVDADGRLVPRSAATTLADLSAETPITRPLNTRFGRPGDTMGLDPDQIGVFDPSYHLKYASGLRATPGQSIIPPFKWNGELQGYSACSMLGSNHPIWADKWGRHVSIVQACDSFGRLRGDVGSIAYIYAGPYAGSAWAFFGVTNRDLFSPGGPLLPFLGAIVDALVARVFLHSFATNLPLYENGETVRLSCTAANFGRCDVRGKVVFRILDRASNQVYVCSPIRVALAAGSTQSVSTEWKPSRFSRDLYRATAELIVNERKIDEIETGFAARSMSAITTGFKVRWRDNYVCDGERPVLLSGTNVTGAMLMSENENPLTWDRDLQRMRDSGLNILRILHISPFADEKLRWKDPDPSICNLPLRLERSLDALVQACQKHHVILHLDVQDWAQVEASDAELEIQRRVANIIAKRYRDVPGIWVDVRNEPIVPMPWERKSGHAQHIEKLWNDWLRHRYVSDEALRAAWYVSAPEGPIGFIPYAAGTRAWNDIRTRDADEFRNYLINRWVEATRIGIKEAAPNMPLTCGYLQEYWAMNKLLCTGGLDFANMHSYNTPDVLRCDFKMFDRRFEGKSISLGEFGSVVDHDKRTHGADNPNQDFSRYLITGHYIFGEGGSFISNWCWKDMDDVVFPWGVNYSCGGPPKDILLAYRNQSIMLRSVRPVYKEPSVYLVVPVDQMLGGRQGEAIRMIYNAVNALLDARIDFGTIDDRNLDKLPSSARVLVYPIPYAIPDSMYARLKSFVESGGTLMITGDVSYGPLRKRDRLKRLTELCGVRFVSENYSDVGWSNGQELCINVEPVTAIPTGAGYRNFVGKGSVYFSPQPWFSVGKTFRATAFGEARIGATGGHAFRIFEDSGARTILLVNPGSKPLQVSISEPGCELAKVSLEPNGTGMVRFDMHGRVVGIESNGDACFGDTALRGKGHWALLSADGKPLAKSREMIWLPFGPSELVLEFASKELAVEAGEISDGRWLALRKEELPRLKASNESAFDLRIIAAPTQLRKLGSQVAAEVTLAR
ncbi:MAG: hypothetical protein QHI38_00145 [Armatimonadota bacterium]|nr:hypothetical protein [Armatimonadota bacterium]